MKNLLLFTILMLVYTLSFSQEKSKEEKSKSETVEFLQKDGVLLEKQFYDIGKVSGVSFQTIIITDIITKKKIGALRLETEHYSSIGTDTYIGTLDFDELDACLKSLEYIKTNILPSTPSVYTEFEYKTRDGVKIGTFWSQGKKESKWSLYIQTKSYTNRSTAYISVEKVDEIIDMIKKSLNNLETNL